MSISISISIPKSSDFDLWKKMKVIGDFIVSKDLTISYPS
jgi:hypothetical protein